MARGSPPGTRRWLRVSLWVVLAIIVVALLFTVVFPWVEGLQDDPTLGSAWVEARSWPVAPAVAGRVTGPGRG